MGRARRVVLTASVLAVLVLGAPSAEAHGQEAVPLLVIFTVAPAIVTGYDVTKFVQDERPDHTMALAQAVIGPAVVATAVRAPLAIASASRRRS